MAVTYEMIGNKLMPVVTLGDCDVTTSYCGPDHHTVNGLVLCNRAERTQYSTNEMHNPVVIQFRDRYDIDKLIKDLETLKRKFNQL